MQATGEEAGVLGTPIGCTARQIRGVRQTGTKSRGELGVCPVSTLAGACSPPASSDVPMFVVCVLQEVMRLPRRLPRE